MIWERFALRMRAFPWPICATDIITGEQMVFRRAVSPCGLCIGGGTRLFVPVEIGGRMLVDGGIVENVPISPLESMGQEIFAVAVDLNGVQRYPIPDDVMDVIGNAIDIGMDLRAVNKIREADIVLSLDLSGYNRLGNEGACRGVGGRRYRPMKQTIRRLLWYKRSNLLVYLSRW